MICRLVYLLVVCSTLLIGQQPIVGVLGEPKNLYQVKRQLIHYHDCSQPGCYTPQLNRQISLAIRFLREQTSRATSRKKLAVVLDIDETSLSNWSVETQDDFAYVPADWAQCVALHCDKAIPATLRLFQEAKKDNVAVFFITGRPDGQRSDTEANLKAEGYNGWAELFMRPEKHPKEQSVSDYKSGDRAKIVSMGYRIVLNIGDQLSDLTGTPRAERSIKLPNPFYFIK
jgi:predicted secreted acid phosphatase